MLHLQSGKSTMHQSVIIGDPIPSHALLMQHKVNQWLWQFESLRGAARAGVNWGGSQCSRRKTCNKSSVDWVHEHEYIIWWYNCPKARVCSSFNTMTVWEQRPRSHHKGATSMQTHSAVKVGVRTRNWRQTMVMSEQAARRYWNSDIEHMTQVRHL